MIEHPNLIPECNVDTVFVEALGYKKPNHAPNINDVFKIFAKRKATEKLIGFVDDDKRKPKEFDFRNLLNTIIQKKPSEIEKVKYWISKFSSYNNYR